jgi:hypothetical protein
MTIYLVTGHFAGDNGDELTDIFVTNLDKVLPSRTLQGLIKPHASGIWDEYIYFRGIDAAELTRLIEAGEAIEDFAPTSFAVDWTDEATADED